MQEVYMLLRRPVVGHETGQLQQAETVQIGQHHDGKQVIVVLFHVRDDHHLPPPLDLLPLQYLN